MTWRSMALMWLGVILVACGGATTQPAGDGDAGDGSTPPDALGAGIGVGAVCSQDGVVTATCNPGLTCPVPAHGHQTQCCADADHACQGDGDCCTGVCLLASGSCSTGGAPGSICDGGSDCVTGSCDGLGECAALDTGAACAANAECASDVCTGGVCVCWPTGTPFPADASVENCCSGSEGLLPDGGQGCG